MARDRWRPAIPVRQRGTAETRSFLENSCDVGHPNSLRKDVHWFNSRWYAAGRVAYHRHQRHQPEDCEPPGAELCRGRSRAGVRFDLIKHDIVVIGGGLAGMRAAVEAAERGADVAIVSKLHPVRSHSGAAQGGINAALGNREDDSPENHAFDCVKGSDYLGDQDAIEAMTADAPKQIVWLEHRGCISPRLPDGRIAQRPFGGAGSPRTCYSADVTGLVILHTLWEQLERFHIKVYEEFFATALCVEDGVGTGVVAYDIRTGELELVHAKATIFATGGLGRVYAKTTNGYASTGDGMAIAYRAGIPLMDMEFVQFHPTSPQRKRRPALGGSARRRRLPHQQRGRAVHVQVRPQQGRTRPRATSFPEPSRPKSLPVAASTAA